MQQQNELARTMERPMPLYEYMVLASSLEAPRTVMRFPLFSSYSRHCSRGTPGLSLDGHHCTTS